jgi:non-homologous end joining protein Ku
MMTNESLYYEVLHFNNVVQSYSLIVKKISNEINNAMNNISKDNINKIKNLNILLKKYENNYGIALSQLIRSKAIYNSKNPSNTIETILK